MVMDAYEDIFSCAGCVRGAVIFFKTYVECPVGIFFFNLECPVGIFSDSSLIRLPSEGEC